MKEWFHVPGIIGAPTNTGLAPTYGSYLVFIKELTNKLSHYETSFI